MTLTEAMGMLARQMGAEGASDATVQAYTTDVRHFVAFLSTIKGRDGITYFTTENVQRWMIDQAEKGLAPATRNRRLAALAHLALFLESTGKIEKDPTRTVRRVKKPRRVTRYLTAEVAMRLIRAGGSTVVNTFDATQKQARQVVYRFRNEAILRTFIQGGLRLGEVVGLSLRDLQKDGLLVLGKGDKERVVKLSSRAMDTIKRWLVERKGGEGPEDALFTNHHGKRLSRRQIARVVRMAAKTLQLEGVHPHLLRHTTATLMRERGAELDVIRDRLGHESMATTERYLHAVPINQAGAANLLADL
jgi:site-specific recombinase XerD